MENRELMHLLGTMDLPKHRYDHLNKINIEWLYKNLPKRNSDKPKFDIVYEEVTRRYQNKIYDN